MKDALYNIGSFFIFLLVVCALCAPFLTGVYFLERSKCRTFAEELEVEHRYDMIAGCRLKVDGKFTPIEQLRDVR